MTEDCTPAPRTSKSMAPQWSTYIPRQCVKILDFVQFGGPEWTVGSTIFEMWLGLGSSPRAGWPQRLVLHLAAVALDPKATDSPRFAYYGCRGCPNSAGGTEV